MLKGLKRVNFVADTAVHGGYNLIIVHMYHSLYYTVA